MSDRYVPSLEAQLEGARAMLNGERAMRRVTEDDLLVAKEALAAAEARAAAAEEALREAIAEIEGSPYAKEPWGYGIAYRIDKWRALASAGAQQEPRDAEDSPDRVVCEGMKARHPVDASGLERIGGPWLCGCGEPLQGGTDIHMVARQEPPPGWITAEGDVRCGAVHHDAKATCLLPRGHEGSHRNTQGYWRPRPDEFERQGPPPPPEEACDELCREEGHCSGYCAGDGDPLEGAPGPPDVRGDKT